MHSCVPCYVFFAKFLSVYFDFFLGQGQNLARETKCLHSLCDIFRLDPLLYNNYKLLLFWF